MIEQLQRRVTKFILNDYELDYYDHLLKLNLLPIMYTYELTDIVFAIKSLKAPNSNFEISKFLSFTVRNTRSAAQRKLKHVTVPNNKVRHFYLIDFLACGMPSPVDLSLLVSTNRLMIDKFLWSHFKSNFKSNDPCSYHFVCPRNKCTDIPHPPILSNEFI